MTFAYNTVVLAKPEAYDGLTAQSAEALLKADQQVLGGIKSGLIDLGIEQLKARTGYTNDNLPDTSPVDAEPFVLDGITFQLYTTVRRNNPKYQEAYDQIQRFLALLDRDWEWKIRKDCVRTYRNGATGNSEPFINLDYLMATVYDDIGRVTRESLGVENKFKGVEAPDRLDESLDRLVIPVALMKDFDIHRPGAAELWYKACRFYQEITEQTVEPFRRELEERAAAQAPEDGPLVEHRGRTESVAAETQTGWETVRDYLFRVQRVPSPRRQPGKALTRLFKIPEVEKEEGELPRIITAGNFRAVVEEYRPKIAASLRKWRNMEGNVGELVTFLYGIEGDPKVSTQFSYLPEYQVERDGDQMFVRVRGLRARMKALEEDYTKNRVLARHDAIPLAPA